MKGVIPGIKARLNMESEIAEASVALSPIIIALIGAAAGLASGVVGSLIAPWVQYAIESKRKRIEYRQNLIKEIRELVDRASTIAEIRRSSFWGFISENLTSEEREKVFPKSIKLSLASGLYSDSLTEDDERKVGISEMLSRLEVEWKLTTV